MNPRQARIQQAESEPHLDLSSLIDVSFLLLIYFLITSTLDPKEADLAVDIGNGTSSSSYPIDYPEITVSADGSIFWFDELIEFPTSGQTLSELDLRLSEFRKAATLTQSEPAVIVGAEDGARSQRFVDVMNALAEAKITNVMLRDFTD